MYYALENASNLFISPLSIYSALSLVLSGCASQSKLEIIKALKLADKQEIRALSEMIGHDLQSVTEGDKKNTLVQANGLFINDGFSILKEYSDMLTGFYKTKVLKVIVIERLRIAII